MIISKRMGGREREREKACDTYGVKEGVGVTTWSKQTTWKT
jgi:hypothetical protein